ncbi:Brp/Blh family beta-carotene 15,15'-monooxygenase [Neolewinella xylanilytica]|uniref:Probable beta-carotene 15,15'-dioxygenase n=1 Tax=Neolewinella xylanilytica TaxID=1514080 RepID=A0A2S6I4D0_9BACT|nr:Brp/Blh family beta-carotene 15,15'-dioxygenase [Neolewinella xylanilytica]PPK86030.1 Brp/Blh family beta-carotene 15,15'-monooxygenase [Neolewinella xylanilytica]
MGTTLSWIVRGLSLVAIAVAPATDGPTVALILLAMGIPHGAADHLIFRSRQPAGAPFVAAGFVLYYLGVVTAYTLLWWWLPGLALIGFLGMSVYHFGQPDGGPLPSRLLWGCFVLGFPVFYHYPEAEPIVSGMIGWQLRLPAWTQLAVPAVLVAGNLAVATYRWQPRRLIDLAVLTVIYLTADLLLGFAIFFLLWHSLPALIQQWQYLRRHRLTGGWSNYIWQLLPLTVGAFASMAIAYVLMDQRGGYAPDLSLLFIMVSLITLPHAILVDRIYRS